VPPQARTLPDGRRLHLQHGPIDLVVEAFGEPAAVAGAYGHAIGRFDGLLDELCDELALLRSPAGRGAPEPGGPVARRMAAAVAPFAARCFVTPMAAVAGAVADEILAVMLAEGHLERAYVNNGGDIALHCAPGRSFVVGMIDRPERPSLFGRAEIDADCGIGGIATSGWRGRSFSFGIADSVTVLASTAAGADAAATVVANAVDLPGHPAVMRVPADSLQPDSDLGSRLVTRDVGRLSAGEIDDALATGVACAEALLRHGLALGAALHLQGTTRVARPLIRRFGPPSPLAGEGGRCESNGRMRGMRICKYDSRAGEIKFEPQEIHAHA
jgi:hypothetical protein